MPGVRIERGGQGLALLALLWLTSCAPLVVAGEPCTSGEVACGYRVSAARAEWRCWDYCSQGRWVVGECLPACGAGMTAVGYDNTECQLPPLACRTGGSEGS